MTKSRMLKAQQCGIDGRGRALVFLSGAVVGVAVAAACHAARANSTPQMFDSEPSAGAPIQRQLTKPARDRTADVVRQSRDSVCLIEGAFIFRDPATGSPLRRRQWLVTGS